MNPGLTLWVQTRIHIFQSIIYITKKKIVLAKILATKFGFVPDCKFYKHLGTPNLETIAKFEEIVNRGGPTGLQARGRNWGQQEIQSHMVPKTGVSRWRRSNSDIYSQNNHFGLVYDMIYQFLGMEAKNYKFRMFCQQCHPSMMPIIDREMPPGFTSAICLHRNFVYISTLENRGDKSVRQNF